MSKEKLKGSDFPLPDCWNNDVRMDVLFSPFRPKIVNPENYASKLIFWKGMLEKYCTWKGSCDFSKTELSKIFVRKGKIPYGLQTVIDEMLNTKEIRLKSEFLSDPLNSWKHWAVNSFVKRPIYWGIHLIASNNEPNESIYIHLDILQGQSKDLNVRLKEFKGKVLTLDKLLIQETHNFNKEGLLICLQYLHSLKEIYLNCDEKSNYLIKIPNDNELSATLTETDRAIYNLENLQEKVLKDVENIEAELKTIQEKIKQHIREGQRSLAKNYLKKKHLLETKIEKKHKSLHNVQILLSQVEEAQSHGEILDAYKIGSNTLKNIVSKSEMNIEAVDEIMMNVREAIEIHDEIQQSIGFATSNSTDDDSLLEEELNNLISNDNKLQILESSQNEVDSSRKNQDSKGNVVNDEDDELLAQLEMLEVEDSALPSISQAKIVQLQ